MGGVNDRGTRWRAWRSCQRGVAMSASNVTVRVMSDAFNFPYDEAELLEILKGIRI